MNSSIYIFGNMQQGYTQYPDDETTHEIFQNFALSAKAPTQLAIHRDGSLMYYGYIRKLIGEQYIGLCVLLNGHMVNDMTALFTLFERTMEQLAEQGYLIKFDTDGSLIANTDHLYMSKTEVDSVSSRLQQEFESLDGCITTLPPVNYTQSMDSVGTFNFSDDALKIVESTHNNGYTYVYKRKGFNTATMDSYKGVLEAVNTENEALKRQIEQMKAERISAPTTVNPEAKASGDSNILRNLVIFFVVIALGLIGYVSYQNVHTSDKVEYEFVDNTNDESANAYQQQTQQRRTFNDLLKQGYVYLQGHISEGPVSMYLKFYQNEEGYESMRDDIVFGILHYDNQPANAILMVEGNFTRDGSITLREFDGNRHSGDIHGTLDGYSFDGEYVTSNLAFIASVQDNPKIPATYEKLTDWLFSEYYSDDVVDCAVIAFTDKKVFTITESTYYSSDWNQYLTRHILTEYDVTNGSIVSKKNVYNPDEVQVLAYSCKNQKITFIGQTVFMNGGFRGVVGQLNIATDKWKDIASEIVSAEFIDNGNKLQITGAKSVDYYDDYDYEAYGGYWKYTYRTINL